jgi:hypothetical protein
MLPVMACILTVILYNFKFEFFSVLQGIPLINEILPNLRYHWWKKQHFCLIPIFIEKLANLAVYGMCHFYNMTFKHNLL